MNGFDLRRLVRDVAAQSTTADPPSIAKQVLDQIDRRHTRDALEQAMPVIVQHVISRDRGVAGAEPTTEQAADVTHTKGFGGGRSAKVASIREWWRRQLDAPVAVGPDRNDWKFLRDCTAPDLDYAAGLREELARSNAAAAQRMRLLAQDLRRTGAVTVGEFANRADAA